MDWSEAESEMKKKIFFWQCQNVQWKKTIKNEKKKKKLLAELQRYSSEWIKSILHNKLNKAF